MSKLNQPEEQRFNEILEQFAAPDSQTSVEIKIGQQTAFRGVPGEAPVVDQMTPNRLEKLEQALETPQEYAGELSISVQNQAFQVSNGQVSVENQPATAQGFEAQRHKKLEEQRKELQKMREQLEQLQQMMAQQSQVLGQLNRPAHQKLGDWLDNFRDQAYGKLEQWQEKAGEKLQAFSDKVQTGTKQLWRDTKDTAQQDWRTIKDAAATVKDNVTGTDRANDRDEIRRLREDKGMVAQQLGQKSVSLKELQAWKQEATALDRSQGHLKHIDKAIHTAKTQSNNPNQSVQIKNIDYRAMNRDRGEYSRSEIAKAAPTRKVNPHQAEQKDRSQPSLQTTQNGKEGGKKTDKGKEGKQEGSERASARTPAHNKAKSSDRER